MKKNEVNEELGITLKKEQLFEKVMFYVMNEGLKHSEAIIEVCEEYNIEPEDIAKIINGPLKERLKIEAMKHNVIPNTMGNTLFGL